VRTLIRARHVLGFADGDHVLYRDGEVVYEGSEILHAGVGWSGSVDQVIDAGNALIAPGFIDLDAIADLDHAILESWAPSGITDGYSWSESYFRHRRRDVFTREERLFIREYAIVQLLRHGVTTCMPIAAETHSRWAETCEELLSMADAARRLGIRAYLGPSYRGGVNVRRDDGSRDVLWDAPAGQQSLNEALKFLDTTRSRSVDLVRGALLPCRIETLTIEQMRTTAKVAKATGVPVRLHCLQGRAELALVRSQHNCTPVELLRDTGLLGPQLLIPHAFFVGGYPRNPGLYVQELSALADAGVSIVHCPLASFRCGEVLESFDRYREAGINIALGSDSYPPDLVRAMDVGNNVAKVVEGRLDAGSVADYFRAATIGGATALGRSDLGRLLAGAQADLNVFGLSDPHIGPADDPVRTILMNGSARDLHMTVVAGRVVMRDGVVPGVDAASMAGKAQVLFDKMRAAYSERDYLRRAPADLFPPSFPLVGAPSQSIPYQ
jgi:8-oxoguanine deaminase